MLAFRDQENLVHNRQTTAAGKPLNQGIKALQPKTPGNNLKTPFQGRNDENKLFGTGKPGKSTDVTPAPAIRNRAPLGAKTTNAKSQAFKTPGPLQRNGKADNSTNKKPRSGKSKIIVAPAEPTSVDVLENAEAKDEPDYGYAPPPTIPLADPPIEFTYDQSFPHFKGKNLVRGYGEIYFGSPKDEHGVSIRLKKQEEDYKRALEEDEAEELARLEAETHRRFSDFEDEHAIEDVKAGGKENDSNPRTDSSHVSTVKARSAASALSESTFHAKSSKRLPSAAMKPTASSLNKKKPAFSIPRDKPNHTQVSSQHSAPMPVSKNTIGFPKARKALSILPSPERVRSKPSAHPRKMLVEPSTHKPHDFNDLLDCLGAKDDHWLGADVQGVDDDDNVDQDLSEAVLDMRPFKFDDFDDDDFQLPVPQD